MNAEQAKLKSELVRKSKKEHQYNKIIESIDEAASKGERYAYIYDQISKETESLLLNDGYWFSEESFHRDEYSIKINW